MVLHVATHGASLLLPLLPLLLPLLLFPPVLLLPLLPLLLPLLLPRLLLPLLPLLRTRGTARSINSRSINSPAAAADQMIL